MKLTFGCLCSDKWHWTHTYSVPVIRFQSHYVWAVREEIREEMSRVFYAVHFFVRWQTPLHEEES